MPSSQPIHWRQISHRIGWILITSVLCCLPIRADESKTTNVPASSSAIQIRDLRANLQQALAEIDALQKKIDSLNASSTTEDRQSLEQELASERERIEAIETRLDNVAAVDTPAASDPPAVQPTALKASTATASATTASGSPPPLPAQAGYNGGFFVRPDDSNFSLKMNGLFQIRYTGFKPHGGNTQFAPGTGEVNNFDVYLGRMAISGTAFDPSIHYFLQFQGSTAGDGNGIGMLDWFTSKTFSKYLTLQAGRFWTPFSYEYYDNPGNYLFADLSTAEYAFVLPRAIGAEVSGQAGRLSYAAMAGNSVRALDAGGQSNFKSQVSYIGHLQFDLLAPYGYVETDPSRDGATKPELSLWASGAYNPVVSSSAFENVVAGDTTVSATSTAGFRYGFFSLQTTGYFRETKSPLGGPPSDNSWGFGQQAGYYLLPGRLEIAERISGVNWGGLHFPLAGSEANTWFAGPSFPYHRVNEDSVGLNYYLHGHSAKIQMSYSYLHGNTFSAKTFGAGRIWLQTQLMF